LIVIVTVVVNNHCISQIAVKYFSNNKLHIVFVHMWRTWN